MSVDVVYKSSIGNVYNLKLKNQLRIKTANFHKYSWKANTIARRYGVAINRWEKDAITYPVTLVLQNSPAVRKFNVEELHADFERDIITNTPGILAWGDCYIETFAYASSTYPDENKIWTRNEVEFYCPYPFWIQERYIQIDPISADDVTEMEKKYSYQYSYAYGLGRNIPVQTLNYYSGSDFKMVAHGPFSNLLVTINGHVYQVDHACAAGEYMVIDTRQKGVLKGQAYVVDANGDVTDVFDDRNPFSSLFEKIQGETVTIQYSRAFALELTLYMERSEPIAIDQDNYATKLLADGTTIMVRMPDGYSELVDKNGYLIAIKGEN